MNVGRFWPRERPCPQPPAYSGENRRSIEAVPVSSETLSGTGLPEGARFPEPYISISAQTITDSRRRPLIHGQIMGVRRSTWISVNRHILLRCVVRLTDRGLRDGRLPAGFVTLPDTRAGRPRTKCHDMTEQTEPTPSTALERLIGLLDLEPIEVNIYRGVSHDVGSGRVFGGQVLAQALIAARRTVDQPREAHSLHGYFILPGDIAAPIVYFVDRLRDGRSFTTRAVTAIQHGRAIFNLSVSFQVKEEGIVHQPSMPSVPPPESVPSELDLLRRNAHRFPESRRKAYTEDQAIDFRPLNPVDPFAPAPREPFKNVWFRANGPIDGPVSLQQAVLAFASDYGLLTSALLPHGLSLQNPHLQAASLDHSLWFHRDFRADDWLLYSTDSPTAGGARGFTRGAVFNRQGQLVASVAQEGLLRLR